jgi:hypothetical protein
VIINAMPLTDLHVLAEKVGGVESLARYLEIDNEVISTALKAPEGAWTDRVGAMVTEDTVKLIQMPSQGGFFWRHTRKRAVKDWQLLARWSDAIGDWSSSAGTGDANAPR